MSLVIDQWIKPRAQIKRGFYPWRGGLFKRGHYSREGTDCASMVNDLTILSICIGSCSNSEMRAWMPHIRFCTNNFIAQEHNIWCLLHVYCGLIIFLSSYTNRLQTPSLSNFKGWFQKMLIFYCGWDLISRVQISESRIKQGVTVLSTPSTRKDDDCNCCM